MGKVRQSQNFEDKLDMNSPRRNCWRAELEEGGDGTLRRRHWEKKINKTEIYVRSRIVGIYMANNSNRSVLSHQ
jgi:hypothetical protein